MEDFPLFLAHSLPILLLFAPFGDSQVLFTELPYIQNVLNLTTAAELEDFFDVQASVYVDNAYNAYQRFFYRVLSELPKGTRYSNLRRIVDQMDLFLNEENVGNKLNYFDEFLAEFSDAFENIFEYDSIEVAMSAYDFHEIFVSNGIEDLLQFVDHKQLRDFVRTTGNGIQIFLLYNRPFMDNPQIQIFKEIVDEFLEAPNIAKKRMSLKIFLRRSEDLLQ